MDCTSNLSLSSAILLSSARHFPSPRLFKISQIRRHFFVYHFYLSLHQILLKPLFEYYFCYSVAIYIIIT